MTTAPLTERSPARAAWDKTGTVVVPGALERTRFEAIRAETLSRLERTVPYVREEATAHRDGSFASPVHCGFLPAGPELERLAYDKELLAALRAATGLSRLVPRGGAAVVYREGDFQGLHTDTVKATITVGIALTSGLPSMGWAPGLRDAHPDRLAEVIAEHGLFPEGEGFTELGHPYADGSVRAFAGYNVPHWRRKHQGRVGALATLGTTSGRVCW
ncbi:hypothetical protein ABZW10_09810 [Kitasatospora sp. NPDC004723]|uniref:hypothetical protein n=1 Tax=Kitasatospora sp. NPDC004723 TaxID=3154288 RepID=UPI0033B9FB86